MATSDKSGGEKLLYCSFCGKSQHEVRKLIAGPSVFICDECIELCNDIIREESAADKGGKPAKAELPTPREMGFGGRAAPVGGAFLAGEGVAQRGAHAMKTACLRTR